MTRIAGVGMFVSFWPLCYRLSRTVRPSGCAAFAAAWFAAY